MVYVSIKVESKNGGLKMGTVCIDDVAWLDGEKDYTGAFNRTLADAGITEIILSPDKVYYVSAPLVLTHSDTHIKGHKSSVIKIPDDCISYKSGNDSTFFSLFIAETTDKKNISFESFTIDGNRENNIIYGHASDNEYVFANDAQSYPLALVNVTGVTNFQMSDVTVKNAWNGAVWISNCKNFTIEKCKIYDYRIHGIAIRNNFEIEGTSSGGIITGNIIDGGVVGIENIFGVNNLTISGNLIYNNKDKNRFPKWAFNGDYESGTIYPKYTPEKWADKAAWVKYGEEGYIDPRLVGDGAGIESTGTYTQKETNGNYTFTITGNICNENMCGIRLEEESHYISVGNNTCSDNEMDGVFLFCSYGAAINSNVVKGNRYGIRLEKLNGDTVMPYGITICNNSITENTEYGISLSNSSDVNISNNILINNYTSSEQKHAINVYSGKESVCRHINITGNQIINRRNDEDDYGIFSQEQSETGCIIADNNFDNISHPVSFPCDNNIIINNIGYPTEITGMGMIAAGNVSTVIEYSLPYVPWNGEISVTLNTPIDGCIYVHPITQNNFTVNITKKSAADVYFSYKINWPCRH